MSNREDLRVLSLNEACETLGVSLAILHQILERGDIRTVQLGKKKGVPLIELKRFVRGE